MHSVDGDGSGWKGGGGEGGCLFVWFTQISHETPCIQQNTFIHTELSFDKEKHALTTPSHTLFIDI